MFHPDTKIHMQGFLYLFSRTFVDTLQYSLWTVKIFHALWLQQVFCKSCSWLYLLKPVFDRLTAIWNLYLTQMLHLTVEWFWKLTNNLNLFKHPWLFFFPEGLRELFRSLEHDDCSLFTADQLDDVIKKQYLPCPSLWSVFFSIINFKRSTKCQLNVGNFKTKSNLCFFKCGKNLKMTSDTHTGIINIIMRVFLFTF